MSSRLWLESVQEELVRRRLPRREIARLVAELADHLADVTEFQFPAGMMPAHVAASHSVSLNNFTQENMSMDANVAELLGNPTEIAETAVREFRRRKNLLSRSRLAAFCTFVLLPLPALCLAWAAAIALLFAVGYGLACFSPDVEALHELTAAEVLIVHAVMAAILLLPAAAVCALFGRLARKTTRSWRWGLAACLLVAAGTAFVRTEIKFWSRSGYREDSLIVGVGLPSGDQGIYLATLGQFLIPLAVGTLVLGRSARSPQSVIAVGETL